MGFDSIIDKIRNNIIELNNGLDGNFNKKDEIYTSISDNMIKSTQYALDAIKRKQNYIEYKRNINKVDNTEETFNVLDNTNVSDILTYLEYKKKWNKLDKYQKKIKLGEYISNLISNSFLDKNKYNELFNKLIKLIFDKKLKGINYSLETLSIESIDGLTFINNNYKLNV